MRNRFIAAFLYCLLIMQPAYGIQTIMQAARPIMRMGIARYRPVHFSTQQNDEQAAKKLQKELQEAKELQKTINEHLAQIKKIKASSQKEEDPSRDSVTYDYSISPGGLVLCGIILTSVVWSFVTGS